MGQCPEVSTGNVMVLIINGLYFIYDFLYYMHLGNLYLQAREETFVMLHCMLQADCSFQKQFVFMNLREFQCFILFIYCILLIS